MENEILEVLDYSNDGFNGRFPELGEVYSYLIDSRINVFRGDNKWAIAIERVGYSHRSGLISNDVYYFGNCLFNLDNKNGIPTNVVSIFPVEDKSFTRTVEGFSLNGKQACWKVFGRDVDLILNKSVYQDYNIPIKGYDFGRIAVEESARLMTSIHSNLFFASDIELYKSIPIELKKVMVLDKWHHKDFVFEQVDGMSSSQLQNTYDLNRSLSGLEGISFDQFVKMVKHQETMTKLSNLKVWENNRPSSYETWQQIAKVIDTGNVEFYKPTLIPNNHWENWPESGSL
ncbi:MAG: hypothetical protein V4687_08080 [Bacteroidota bacterium]